MEIPLGIYEEITGQNELPPPVDEADYERRKHRRVPFGCRATIFPERKSGDNTPSVVMVRDMSVAGLSVLNAEPLKPGTPFIVEFKGRQDRPVKIRCTAARCEAGGSGGTQFVVGATFDSLLTAELPSSEAKKEEPAPALAEVVAANVSESGDPVDDDVIAEALRGDSDEPQTKQESPKQEPPKQEPAKQELPKEKPPTDEASPPPDDDAEDEPELELESDDEEAVEAEPEPALELIDKESQEKISARLKRSEPEPAPPLRPAPPLESTKPLEPTKTMESPKPQTAPAAPAKTSSIFSSAAAKSAQPKTPPDNAYEMGEAPAPKGQAPAPAPDASAPTFRVIPLPMPEAEKPAVVVMEMGPQVPHTGGGGKHHEILARVKEMLVIQSGTIKNQQQQLHEERQKTHKLSEELAEMKRVMHDLQSKVTNDDSDIAELAAFLDHNTGRDTRSKNSQAA